MLWVGVSVVAAVVAVAAALALFGPWASTGGGSPSMFAPVSITHATPGSLGCRNVSGEICYLAEVASAFSNLAASNLFFAVSDAPGASFPESNTVTLGTSAAVSILYSASVDGIWNFTIGGWSSVPTGMLPTTGPIEAVLDTGLPSNATFLGSTFYIEHSSPYGGSVGFPLF